MGAFIWDTINERNRKLKQADQVANAMYQFMEPPKGEDGSQAANPFGPKDRWDLMSAQERVAQAAAFNQVETLKRAMADQQLQEQQTKARLAEFQNIAQANTALQNAVSAAGHETPQEALGRGNGPVPMQSVPLTPDRLLRAVSASPAAVNSPNLDNLLRAMQVGQAGNDADLYKVVEGKTSTGTPYVTYGRQFSFDPAATTQQRFDAQKGLLSERERLTSERKQKLSASDLLKSYQADLEALNKAWDMPPDERASRRAELQSLVDGLRKADPKAAAGAPDSTAGADFEWRDGKLIKLK